MSGAERALNRVAKWRTLLTGWQLGTRPKGDPEGDAVRDHREATLILRVETNAVIALLLETGRITREAFVRQLEIEADLVSMGLEARFPGVKATDEGLEMDLARTQEWMRGWRP